MTDFAVLSLVKTSATAVDPAFVVGAGPANTAVFGEILAGNLDVSSFSAAAPVVEVPPAVASRQPASGIVLPEGGETLPGDLPQSAGVPVKTQPEWPTKPPARRSNVRIGRPAQSGKVPPPHPQSVANARDSAATSPSATLGTAGDIATTAETYTHADPGGAPLGPVAAVAPIAATPAPSFAHESSPTSAQARARQAEPLAPAPDSPVAREAFVNSSPRQAGERLPAGVALPNADEALAAKVPIISPTSPPLQLPAVVVPGAVLRVAVPAVRAKNVAIAEPAHDTNVVPANLASRGFEEVAYSAPLAASVPGGIPPTSIESPTTSAPTALPPAATAARQDFVALVERLIDSRNAAAPAPVQAALAHSEFGEIALRFTRDERGLNVAMASVDPDFAPAVHAALPAERFERTTPEQPRGQPGASLPQGATDDRGTHNAAPQSRATTERSARLAADPEPRSRDEDRPARRAGIFA